MFDLETLPQTATLHQSTESLVTSEEKGRITSRTSRSCAPKSSDGPRPAHDVGTSLCRLEAFGVPDE
jgi:hypothetical protein